MSVSQPARCLLSAPPKPSLRPRIRCRNFSSTPSQYGRRKQPSSTHASDAKVVKQGPRHDELFKPLSDQKRRALAFRYTPEQMEAIEAGEKAVSSKDLKKRGVIRSDMGTLPYIEDFSRTKTLLDRPQRYKGPIDPNIRLMTPDEQAKEQFTIWQEYGDEKRAYNALMGIPEPVDTELEAPPDVPIPYVPEERVDLMKTEDREAWFVGTDGKRIPREQTPMAFAPGLPRRFSSAEESAKEKAVEQEADPRDPDGRYNKLIRATGMTLDDIFATQVKILVKHRVVNQTRLGKIQSMYFLAIAGNGDGRLGIGEAKGQEEEETGMNARIAAIRAMQPVPRYENRTIYGEVDGKVSAVELKLMARPPGFGLRCQHLIFELCRAAGIHDLAARVPRSRNKMNTVKAAYKALMTQRIPNEIAQGRGKKLVDVRKVYYGGRV